MIDQIIFTSDETEHGSGYHVAAASPGVSSEESQELATWCPSHDGLWSSEAGAESVNFHPLAGGRFVVSRTTAAGAEYSQRAGCRVYTQALLITPEDLRRFGNNPFAVLRAAVAAGKLEIHSKVPRSLESLTLTGGAAPVNQALLARLAIDPGAEKLATLIEAVLVNSNVGLLGAHDARKLFDGLFNCLPPECRPALSFTTGLRPSARRPFRLSCLPNEAGEVRLLQRQHDLAVVDFGPAGKETAQVAHAWARLVRQVFVSGKVAFLSTQLSQERPGLLLDGLDALAATLQQTLTQEVAQYRKTEIVRRSGSLSAPPPPPREPASASEARLTPARDAARLLSGHLAHAARGASESAARGVVLEEALNLDSSIPGRSAMLDDLQRLDDLVFGAIAGSRQTFTQLESLWERVQRKLPSKLVAESREHYVRHALQAWNECRDGEEIRNPARAIAAVEVVELMLSGE